MHKFYIGSQIVGNISLYGKREQVWGNVVSVQGDSVRCHIGFSPGSRFTYETIRMSDVTLDPDMPETNQAAEQRGMR